jgi:aspartate oxidase
MNLRRLDTDVLVIGGGLAGLNAALAASEASSRPRVAICDAGGCASTEVMGFCAPLAPGDSPELFAEDVLAAGRGANDPALARRLAEDAGGVVSFLERLGIEFDREADGSYALLRPLGSRFPRVVHSSTKTGCLAMERIRAALEARSGVEFRNARVVKLFKDGARISGALAFEDGRPLLIAAKSVVLAGGGAAGLSASPLGARACAATPTPSRSTPERPCAAWASSNSSPRGHPS